MTYSLLDGFTMREIKTKDFGEIKAYVEHRMKTWELVEKLDGFDRYKTLAEKYKMLTLLDEIEDAPRAGKYCLMVVNQLEIIND